MATIENDQNEILFIVNGVLVFSGISSIALFPFFFVQCFPTIFLKNMLPFVQTIGNCNADGIYAAMQ